MTDPIRIFLADDHDLVRDGLKALLGGIPDIKIAGEAANGQELLDRLKSGTPDLVVLDLSLPDISGIEIIRIVAKEYPEVKILVLSMHTGEEFVLSAVRAGAKGYVPKNTSRNELVEAIYSVYRGEEFFGKDISRILLKSYLRNNLEPSQARERTAVTLSDREKEVIRLSAEGFSNSEIGEKLQISIRTVETHKNHVMKKLGLKSTVELVKFAIRSKLIEL
ncbi:MAG TPA: response regulator transcription factor [Bacteroidales bacterium]|nr:response regulator transcription factor [Bacteroidales bacterium]